MCVPGAMHETQLTNGQQVVLMIILQLHAYYPFPFDQLYCIYKKNKFSFINFGGEVAEGFSP